MTIQPQAQAQAQARKQALLDINDHYRLGLLHASTALPHALTPPALAHEALLLLRAGWQQRPLAGLLMPMAVPALSAMARRPRLWAALGALGLLAGLVWQGRLGGRPDR